MGEFYIRSAVDPGASDEYNAIIDIVMADMASILIRNLDDRTKNRLRVRAAHNSRSMEDEARTILREALAQEPVSKPDLASAIGARFRALGGVELELPERQPPRKPPRPS